MPPERLPASSFTGSAESIQRLGKVLATLAASAFAYMAYQAMKANERTHHTHNAGHAPVGSTPANSGWFLRLCVVGLVAMVGGVLSRGPVKPIKLSDAPPITGVVPSYTDFLQARTRASLLGGVVDSPRGRTKRNR